MTTRLSTSSPPVVLAHPSGNGPFVRHATRALYEAGLLREFVTTYVYGRDPVLDRLLTAVLRLRFSDPRAQLGRRSPADLPGHLIASHPLPEFLRAGAQKMGASETLLDSVWERTELWFDRIVARKHVIPGGAVYGYEHATLAAFRRQHELGGVCILEQPIAHHTALTRIVYPELELFPELQSEQTRVLTRLAPRRDARKDAELALADLVVVNSSFTRQTLEDAGVDPAKIVLIPLGSPPVQPPPHHDHRHPMVFLYAGTLSVRKGVHYLLDAWRTLNPGSAARLRLVGSNSLPKALLTNLPSNVCISPPVPHTELLKLYGQAHVFVFPSLLEGFGMVITEAMSRGLPVITTPHTAGPDVLTPRVNGMIVPIRDPIALAGAMEWMLQHPEETANMGVAATEAAARWQWSDFRTEFAHRISTFVCGVARSPSVHQTRP